jgi:hypothetical protein
MQERGSGAFPRGPRMGVCARHLGLTEGFALRLKTNLGPSVEATLERGNRLRAETSWMSSSAMLTASSVLFEQKLIRVGFEPTPSEGLEP